MFYLGILCMASYELYISEHHLYYVWLVKQVIEFSPESWWGLDITSWFLKILFSISSMTWEDNMRSHNSMKVLPLFCSPSHELTACPRFMHKKVILWINSFSWKAHLPRLPWIIPAYVFCSCTMSTCTPFHAQKNALPWMKITQALCFQCSFAIERIIDSIPSLNSCITLKPFSFNYFIVVQLQLSAFSPHHSPNYS